MNNDDVRMNLVNLLDSVKALYSTGIRPPAIVSDELPSPVPAGESVDTENRTQTVDELSTLVLACKSCGLAGTRKTAVPGTGVRNPLVFVVGEAPGADEDEQGLPFVGKAGKYLDEWLAAIGLDRTRNVYISNVVKCRPPGNRDPQPDEIEACVPWLASQIAILKPKAILTLGKFALSFFKGDQASITRLHGQRFEYEGLPVFPTYHPSAVLRSPELRRDVWEDLKGLHAYLHDLGELPPLPKR